MIDTIEELYDLAENYRTKVINLNLEGEKTTLSSQYYVEDDVCYWFATNREDSGAIIGQNVIDEIEHEGQDDCWQPDSIKELNRYLECELVIAVSKDSDIENAVFYEIANAEEVDGEITLICYKSESYN